MGQSLVIVESKAKAKTIGKILGEKFLVMSTEGQLRYLPSEKLGITIDNGFEPEYIDLNDKEKIIRSLKTKAEQSECVYIATDPDGEGEVIAWHLADALNNSNKHIHRIVFNKVTNDAVKQAIEHPQQISKAKVDSYNARMILDRLVDHRFGSMLQKALSLGLQVERVPLIALRILCDREQKITTMPVEAWKITAEFKGKKSHSFYSELLRINDDKILLPDQYHAQVVSDDIRYHEFVVLKKVKIKWFHKPEPPFITSTLIQAASQILGFSATRTIKIVRQLYEGVETNRGDIVGLITYYYTESTFIPEEILITVRELILTDYGIEYLPKKPNKYPQSASSQNGQESIRPTLLRRIPKSLKNFLTKDQYNLYKLIWQRFVAGQMKDAEFNKDRIDIGTSEENRYFFQAENTSVVSRGFFQVYEDLIVHRGNEKIERIHQNLQKGDKLTLINILTKRKSSPAIERFDESSLFHELSRRGVMRPETCARTVDALITLGFLNKDNGYLIPTNLGQTVNNLLIQHFPSVNNVPFTAKIEEELDRIKLGLNTYHHTVKEFYASLSSDIKKKDRDLNPTQDIDNEKCPQCGKNLVLREGKFGQFYACEDFRHCKFTKSAGEETSHINEKCVLCGGTMVVKVGRFGRFLACTNYPKCKNTKPFHVGVKCPQNGCDGDVIERISGKGRMFYGCSNYPKCKFMSWQKPVGYRCLQCGNFYVVSNYSDDKGEYLSCPKCKTDYDLDMVAFGESVEYSLLKPKLSDSIVIQPTRPQAGRNPFNL